MSLSKFASGFVDGARAGVAIGTGIREGNNVRGIQEANEVLAEMQNMTPGFKAPSAIPEAGENNGPVTGYSGDSWNVAKTKYIKALKKVSDPDALDAMMDRMAELEKGKVMEYGRMALASLKAGDTAAAQNYLAGVSFFTNPGSTPTVKVMDDGTVLYGEEGRPPIALRSEDIEDMLHQFVDFDGYRDLAFDRQVHKDMMDYRERTRLDQIAQFNAEYVLKELDYLRRSAETDSVIDLNRQRMDLAREQMDATKEKLDAELENLRARTEKTQVDTEAVELGIAKTLQEMDYAEKALQAGVQAEEMERINGELDSADEFLKDYTDLEKLPKEGAADGDPLMSAIEEPEGAQLSPQSQALVDSQTRQGKLHDSMTKLRVQEVRNRQAAVMQALSAPQTRADFDAFVRGLVAGDKAMTGDRAAAIALSAIMSNGTSYEPFFDASTGTLVMRNNRLGTRDYYRVHPSHHDLFGTRFDPPSQPPPQDKQGIPQ